MADQQTDFEISFFERLVRDHPNFVDALKPLAEAYTKKGLYEKGLHVDRRLAQLCPRDAGIHYNLACSYALLGKKDAALLALERSVELGYDDLEHLKKDPDLKSLRNDPRFKSLLSQKTL